METATNVNPQTTPSADPQPQAETIKPKKRIRFSTIFIVFLFLLLVAGLGILSYLYFTKDSRYKTLLTQKENLETQNSSLTSEKETLQSEKATLEEENATLTAQIESINTHEAKIKAYNDVLDYTFVVVSTHNGFSGWTEEEYQHARDLASISGDDDFVAQVDTAWNDKHISATTRFVNFIDFISTRIDENLSVSQ